MASKIAAIRLGVENLARSRRLYTKGFGWSVHFGNDGCIFYDMGGGLLFETWQQVAFEAELGRFAIERPGTCASLLPLGHAAKPRRSASVCSRRAAGSSNQEDSHAQADTGSMFPTPIATPGKQAVIRSGRLTHSEKLIADTRKKRAPMRTLAHRPQLAEPTAAANCSAV